MLKTEETQIVSIYANMDKLAVGITIRNGNDALLQTAVAVTLNDFQVSFMAEGIDNS